ncbi:hypothetical protein [Tsukamurella sp. PLM1]|uniref:hypothetical protein n=1 Tax=Tsukamurella sp. PLM1 TaxID=2929795 RepID=UPI0020C1462C|nr:hypothetical protein [Tsukamurella sp. PLM1]
MPDWTYHPVAPLASRVLGRRRTRLWALRFLAVLVSGFGGSRWIPVVFDHPAVPPQWRGRFGATVPLAVARDAIAVLPVQGATVIEVCPVALGDLGALASATAARRCAVVARVPADAPPELLTGVAPLVDRVIVGTDPGVRYLVQQDVAAAVTALAEPGTVVLARPSVLLDAGPAWFNRVIEAATRRRPRSGSPRCRRIRSAGRAGPGPARGRDPDRGGPRRGGDRPRAGPAGVRPGLPRRRHRRTARTEPEPGRVPAARPD